MDGNIVNDEWISYLAKAGAVLDDRQVRHFGNPEQERRAAANNTILVPLTHLSLIRARGEEATAFLNNQLSNDVRQVDDAHGQLAAYCTAKGRILAIFRIFRRDGHYLLQLPASLQNCILERLRKYVLRAKVTLESADQELCSIGVSGPDAPGIMQEITPSIPDGDDACLTQNGITVLRLPGVHPRFACAAPTSTAITLWEELSPKAVKAGPGTWVWLDIMAGLPTILPETSEAFVPQMVNLELLSGVSFEKGCYPGQEIVARMHYLGKPKQRMVRAHVSGEAASPQPGDAVYAPGLRGQAAGRVVVAQPAPGGGYDLLAVIQTSRIADGSLSLHSETGPRLEVQALPYTVPTPESSQGVL